MKETTRKVIRDQVKQIAKGVGVTFGVEVIVDYDDNYPVLFNSENLTHFVVDSLKDQNIPEVNNIVYLGPQNPSEDFHIMGKLYQVLSFTLVHSLKMAEIIPIIALYFDRCLKRVYTLMKRVYTLIRKIIEIGWITC